MKYNIFEILFVVSFIFFTSNNECMWVVGTICLVIGGGTLAIIAELYDWEEEDDDEYASEVYVDELEQEYEGCSKYIA